MPHHRILVLFLLLIICHSTALSQRRNNRRTSTPSQSSSRSSATSGEQYWAAQRSIEAAIQELEAYLRAEPNGERAATARQQLEVLRSLNIAAARPEWASMSRRISNSAPDWRIASVEQQPDKARVAIEIRCPRQDGGDCYFTPFDSAPLVLVDNAGRFYPMLEISSLPRDIRITGHEQAEQTAGQAVLPGGRVIIVTVDFAPLSRGIVSVQLYYRDNNQAIPAIFSLAGRR